MDECFASEEERTAINALHDISEQTLQIKLEYLKKWIDQCPHLPLESKDDWFLQIMLLRGKFQEQLVKKNIENYFSYLCRYREFFMGLTDLKPASEVGVSVALPVLTPSWERVAILKLNLERLKKGFDVHRCISGTVATAMIYYNYDYVPSVRIIMDFEGWLISHILQVNMNKFFKLMDIYQNILKIRISGIEIINAPHLLGAVLNISKLVFKPKLFARITVHEDLHSLHKNVPKQNLPSDYEGDLQSTEELLKVWDPVFRKKKCFLEKIEQLSQRNNGEQGVFGIQGSFKTLVVD